MFKSDSSFRHVRGRFTLYMNNIGVPATGRHLGFATSAGHAGRDAHAPDGIYFTKIDT
jgi:hypothetical protein